MALIQRNKIWHMKVKEGVMKMKKNNVPNIVFIVIFIGVLAYYSNYKLGIGALFSAIGYCSLMIPFVIGYNVLKKDSTAKRIMGNVVIATGVITILVFVIFIFNLSNDNNSWSASIKQYNEAADRAGSGKVATGSNQQTKQQVLGNNVVTSFRVLSGGTIGLSDVTSQPRFEYTLDNFGDGRSTARQMRDAALNSSNAELAAKILLDVAQTMVKNGDWIGQVPSGMRQASPTAQATQATHATPKTDSFNW
jgi:hypothetical protein